MTSPEARVRELGLTVPDYADPPYGGRYGTVKPFHRVGNLLLLSGITPEDRAGNRLHPGRLGDDVTVEQGREAARMTAVNALGLIRLAVGSLDRVTAMGRNLCFLLTTEDFEDLHLVSDGASQLFVDVFGPTVGVAGRASIGVSALSRKNCFELWTELEVVDHP
ncbi:RidA family protein [Actinoplanes rectilineatus]|uniref:RidA family protein n=1 Tax=Actinoplanes rectilineatus TaxID=113571 RepID=UPI0005F29BDF|nr:RidA family protein [Actinoplanes rectilineatus]